MKRILLASLLTAVMVVAVPGAAQAAPCPGTSGVTVLVQYGDGPTQVGCAKGDPTNGYDALKGAGFTVTQAQGSGSGAICQINGYPGKAFCGSMPPANAYWAYFHPTSGGGWKYSTEGGGTFDPAPGSVEGWRFQDSTTATAPSSKPPVVAASTPTPTRKPSAKPAEPAPAPTATDSTSASTSPTASASATAKPTRAPSTSTAGTPTAGTPTAGDSAQAFDEPGPVVSAKTAPSGGTSWIWGVGLLAVLAAVGGLVAVRRRQG